jgi:hypothetical protein
MSNFPNFDFKIDCGDDPRVRQWLHENGVVREHMSRPVATYAKCINRLSVVKKISVCCFGEEYAEIGLPEINPYDYMQQEPTVAERSKHWLPESAWYGIHNITGQAEIDQCEMIKRDQAGMPKVNIKYTPPAKRLTIPAICLADQAMPMMLGGNFGGMSNG